MPNYFIPTEDWTTERVGLVVSCDPRTLPDAQLSIYTFSRYLENTKDMDRHYFLLVKQEGTLSVWTPLWSKPTESRVYLYREHKRGRRDWTTTHSYADPRIMWVMPTGLMVQHSSYSAVPSRVAEAGIPDVLLAAAARALSLEHGDR